MHNIEVCKDRDIIKIFVVGMGMRNEVGVTAGMFKLFTLNRITFKTDDKDKSVKAICEEFNL